MTESLRRIRGGKKHSESQRILFGKQKIVNIDHHTLRVMPRIPKNSNNRQTELQMIPTTSKPVLIEYTE